MVKTNAPSGSRSVVDRSRPNALPDPFDELDLLYRPKLQPLPPTPRPAGRPADPRPGRQLVHRARGRGPRRHGPRRGPGPRRQRHGAPRDLAGPRVSPYMLYAMARRYDEFPGTADVGSSLRGAFKGWYHHGVCTRRHVGRRRSSRRTCTTRRSWPSARGRPARRLLPGQRLAGSTTCSRRSPS